MPYHDDDDFKPFEYDGGEGKGKYDDDKDNFKVSDDIRESGGFRKYEQRTCTDLLFLIVFFAAMGLMFFLGVDGLMKGDPGRLMAPLDGDKKFCGSDVGYEDYGKLFIPLKQANLASLFGGAVCVKTCPQNGVQSDCKSTEKHEDCPTPAYNSADTFGVGYCLPESIDGLPKETLAALKLIKDSFLQSGQGQYVVDINKAKYSVIICCLLSFVVCIGYVKLMSAIAEPIAWLCVVLIQIGLFAASAASYYALTYLQEQFEQIEDPTEQQQNAFKYQTIGCWVMVGLFALLGLIFLISIICGFSHLKLAIDVIDASADFLDDNKQIYFVPLFFFVCAFVSIIVWAVCVLGVYSEGKIRPDPIIPQVKTVELEDKQKYMLWYMLFAILWLTAWFEYANSFVVMHSAVQYYFMWKKNEETDTLEKQYDGVSTKESLKCAFLKHPGSIAIGAFVIALIRFIRIVFIYLAKQIEKQSGENPVVKLVLRCVECLLWCLEKIADYINEAGYAYMAVSGDSFCSSAWSAFLLNLKHLAKFVFANNIATVFVALGKGAIVVINMGIAYYIMTLTGSIDQVSSVVGPLLCVGLVTFVTASIFLGLLDQTVMAMMTSLAVDMDLNNGEYKFGPETFHERIGKVSNKVEPKGNEMM